jgi:hypothetical protein
MVDLMFAGILLAFLAASWAFVLGCGRLQGGEA